MTAVPLKSGLQFLADVPPGRMLQILFRSEVMKGGLKRAGGGGEPSARAPGGRSPVMAAGGSSHSSPRIAGAPNADGGARAANKFGL